MIAVLIGLIPVILHAQSENLSLETPKDGSDGRAKETPEIFVSGKRRAIESLIDRESYQVSSDLQSASGSVSDVLRNLPSVDVDAQGNVSLRGDTKVQILIDGKPSTTTTTANRADTLEQIPANTIDHIEVISNRSAQCQPDGSSGIINIVTKKDREPGASGSIRTSTGTD